MYEDLRMYGVVLYRRPVRAAIKSQVILGHFGAEEVLGNLVWDGLNLEDAIYRTIDRKIVIRRVPTREEVATFFGGRM